MRTLSLMAAIAVIGLIMRCRATLQQPAMAGAGRMPYTQTGSAPGGSSWPVRDDEMPRPVDAAAANVSAPDDSSQVSTRNIPTDFDVANFERQAKVNFIRL